MGRPSSFTQEMADEVCRRLENKQSLLQVTDDPDMPSKKAVLNWLNDNEKFRNDFARARETGYDRYCDEIFALCKELLDGPNRKVVVNQLMDMFQSGEVPKWETLDELLKSMLTHEKVAAVKITIDANKWILSKMLPKQFGDKVELEHKGDIQISQITRKVVDPLVINQTLTEKVLAVTQSKEEDEDETN